ncbi:AraC family transcriptional regulator [Variovorax sp. J22R115]|uniref:AraC family transcriptional regulator n=1 Tax=Variovorax sp. J22R115 TaxID=3053509 RepID=UPI0025766F39|nr:AraC family transcriptional regulator [Variovorax sp. J22R115]MDM0054006.1 AraC family transcriptional regulator [Variovorax sp. J22R115]
MIRSAALTDFAAVARSVGVDPIRMLDAAGLDRSCLVDPEIRIPGDTVRGLIASTARLSGIEDFGLRMAENRSLSNLGPLGLVVKEEPTLREALHAVVRYMRLHNESLLLRIEEADGRVTIHQQLITAQPNQIRQSVELGVGVLFRIMQLFLGTDWKPLYVCFVHTAPADFTRHRRLFGPVVQFDADFDGIVCRSEDLDMPIRDSDPVLAQYARAYLDSLLAAKKENTFADKVRELVVVLLPAGQCTTARVAQHMNVDRRTLHRHLAAEGRPFTSLVDEVRSEWVMRHLPAGNRALSDIAEFLGFSGLSSFSRWFRTHFGCSVTQWRANQQAPEG